MQGFYTPSQLAQMRGGGESTWRLRAARGEFKNAVKQGNTWFIPMRDVDKWGPGYDKEFAEPQPLSPECPTDPSSIVLAQNSDDRYGVYISEHWFGAGQALAILDYLEKHKDWLVEKSEENRKQR